MTIQDKFKFFHDRIMEKYERDDYNSIINKRPFDEEEGMKTSIIHDLIEAGYLNLISLDISEFHIFRYSIHLTDKAIKEVKDSQLELIP